MPTDDFISQFRQLHGEFDQLFAELIAGPRAGSRDAGRAPVDVYLTDDPPAVTVQLDVAGVDPEAIEVMLDGRLLVIRGERRRGSGERRHYQHAEIDWGPFERRLRLEVLVDPDATRADYDRGILTITLPITTRQAPERRSIDITGGAE